LNGILIIRVISKILFLNYIKKSYINCYKYYRCCAIHLKSESQHLRKRCCLNGFALDKGSVYPKLCTLPEHLYHYCFNDLNDFSKKSSYYNNILCFSSIGVENGKGGGFEKIKGDHSVKLNGRTYHYFANSKNIRNGINYFTFDAFFEMEKFAIEYNNDRKSKNYGEIFQLKTLKNLFHELKEINPYAADLNLIGNELKKLKLCGNKESQSNNVKTINTLSSNIGQKTHHLEIGAIVSDGSDGNINFKYKLKDQLYNIPSTSKFVEPLTFPLLFPFGESGWDINIKKSISFLSYILSRWLMPEITTGSCIENINPNKLENCIIGKERNCNGDFVLMHLNKNGTRLIPTNRFQLMCRVAQYHLVDGISRSIDYTLQWHKKNTNLIFGMKDSTYDDYYHNINDNQYNNGDMQKQEQLLKKHMEREEFSNSNPTFLSGSFHGGQRHLKALAMSSLIIVSDRGQPSLFITVTCNPLWSEIVEMLLPGQSAFDRPDITVRVFHEKLSILLENIRNGIYFGDSIVIYELRVIEYQHRGLPHCHIILKLSNVPSKTDSDECCDWIDKWISAERPDPIEEPILYEKVDKHMGHKCHNGVNGCLGEDGICKNGFSNIQLREKTVFDEKGYPLYRKRKKTDLNIVSYHKQILLDMDCHVNVAFCGKTYAVLYLYKYLFKGIIIFKII